MSEQQRTQGAYPSRRTVPVWLFGSTAVIAVAAIIALGFGVVTGDDDKEGVSATTANSVVDGASSGRNQVPLTIDDVEFVSCDYYRSTGALLEPIALGDLPAGATLRQVGLAVSDSQVLLVGRTDGRPMMNPPDAVRGDFALATSLTLLADGEPTYEFNMGLLTFAALLPGPGRNGGLVDPNAVDYFLEGDLIGVVVDRAGLSALDRAKVVSATGKGRLSVLVENSLPATHRRVIDGWEEVAEASCESAVGLPGPTTEMDEALTPSSTDRGAEPSSPESSDAGTPSDEDLIDTLVEMETSADADDLVYVAHQVLGAITASDEVELARWATFAMPAASVNVVDPTSLRCDSADGRCEVRIGDRPAVMGFEYGDGGWSGSSLTIDEQAAGWESADRCDYFNAAGACLQSPTGVDSCGQLGVVAFGNDSTSYCPEVTRIQAALNSSGMVVDIDGYYGLATTQAVMNFQRFNGLDPDGLVGPKTWAALSFHEPTS